MDIENKKPDGYYDEIEYPFKKKDDIKSFFDKYEIIEHTNSESNYEYLEENDVVLEIVNPYRDENLFIEIAGEFTLYFSSWHSHYFTYEYDYKEMKNDALAIINGEYAALCFFIDDEWFGATLLKEEISHLVSPRDLIAKMNFSEEHLQKIRDKGVVILADYWKPNDCYEFDVSIESENIDYKFFKTDYSDKT